MVRAWLHDDYLDPEHWEAESEIILVMIIKIDQIDMSLLTDLLTRLCGIPGGGAADTAETGGGWVDCVGGTLCGVWALMLCGNSCGVVLWACCNPLE